MPTDESAPRPRRSYSLTRVFGGLSSRKSSPSLQVQLDLARAEIKLLRSKLEKLESMQPSVSVSSEENVKPSDHRRASLSVSQVHRGLKYTGTRSELFRSGPELSTAEDDDAGAETAVAPQSPPPLAPPPLAPPPLVPPPLLPPPLAPPSVAPPALAPPRLAPPPVRPVPRAGVDRR